jgi:hypothetical protein
VFTSLESLSGSLVNVGLIGCSTLASIPKEYGSLERLCIKDCPAIKKLPRCLRQQLDSIDIKYLDAHLEGTHCIPSLPCFTNKCKHSFNPMYHRQLAILG